jgi:threonine/homoserine/homoserine lactone efflux protein
MLLTALLGFTFGFVGSMPLAGPIAFLVMRRGLSGRYRQGFALGAGAAVAEAGYAALAYLGFGAWLEAHPGLALAARGVAAIILAVLGVVFLTGPVPTAEREGSDDPERERRDFGLGFTITALNPTLIGTWAAAATILFSTGLVTFEAVRAPVFAATVAAGITAWFGVLLALLRRFRAAMGPERVRMATRGAGLLLLGVAAWFAVRLARDLLK